MACCVLFAWIAGWLLSMGARLRAESKPAADDVRAWRLPDAGDIHAR